MSVSPVSSQDRKREERVETHSLKMTEPFLKARLATTPLPLMGPYHLSATSPTAFVGFRFVGAEVSAARVACEDVEDEEEEGTALLEVDDGVGKEDATLLTRFSAPSAMPFTIAEAVSTTLPFALFFFFLLLVVEEVVEEGSSFSLFSPLPFIDGAAGVEVEACAFVEGDEVALEEEEGKGNPFVAAH